MRSSTILLAALATLATLACEKTPKPATEQASSNAPLPTSEPVSMNPTLAATTSEASSRLARSSNAFAFDLWRRLGSKPGNAAISPASISLALAMTYGGAKGETAAQMKKALRFEEDPEPLAESWGKLSSELTQPARPLKLEIASRLFGDKGYRFEAPYLERTQAAFGAPLEPLDFQHEAEPSRKRINGWVEERTNQRIKNLLPADSIKDVTRLVLVNAIYFLADWASPFPKERTQKAPFSPSVSEIIDVETMSQFATLPLTRADGVSVLEMPYKGGSASMLVVVPDRIDGLSAVERTITDTKLATWVRALSRQYVALSMPRFEVAPTNGLSLAKELGALGMPLAFDREKADFTTIANPADPRERLHIDDVFHKAFVKVAEKGTEAAAATAVMMAAGGGKPPKPVEVRVDRPFLFFIRDTSTGLLLFMGRVVNP